MNSVLDCEWKLNADESGMRAYYLPSSIMNDSRLTCKAKVVWCYMNSKVNGYNFSSYRIAKDMKEGHKTIQAAMRELEKLKYLERDRKFDGRIEYDLNYNPPSLTKEEAEQCLIEMFPDYYVSDEDFICINDCIEELKDTGMSDRKARKVCDEFWKACDEGGTGQSKEHWKKWKEVYPRSLIVVDMDA